MCLTVFFPYNTTIDFYIATESHFPSCKCWVLSQNYLSSLKNKVYLDTDEQRAVRLVCTRLQELSCKWDGCSVKMNSVDTLIRHLNQQHKPSSKSNSNVCLFF